MLASASPRRRQLLEKAGLGHRVFEAGFEDASMRLSPSATPAFRVMALAWAKAVAARDRLEREAGLEPGEAILAADTLCELDGRILGKPRDATAAARMIRSLADRAHRTLTDQTSMDYILLGVHANTNSEAVAKELRRAMAEAETNALERMQLFNEEGLGGAEWYFGFLDKDWKDLVFPEIVCIRSYPKAGPYEESKSNEDTS